MFRTVSILLALAGIAGAALLVTRLRHVEPPPAPIAEPARAPFKKQIGARGIVESVDENVRIAPMAPGLVTRVFVKVGDQVKAGDALIEQDPRDALAQVRVQEAQVAALEAQISESEVALADRQDQWQRMEKLSENRVASTDEKQRSLFAVKAASSRLATMRAELQSAQAQLARARVQLDLLTIRAPRHGAVLQVNIRAGEHAAPSGPEPVMLLGQIDRFQLRADVDEDNASRIRPPCSAVAFVKGRRDHAIPLQFVRIEPYILPKRSLTGESNERVDTRVLQVVFRFAQPPLPVYVGQQMDVFIEDATPEAPAPAIAP
jgi:HlyD family secretion protein